MRRLIIKNLTPSQAYRKFTAQSEEDFIADMRPLKDIGQMCRIFASEIPGGGTILSTKQIDKIADLLTEHLTDFVRKKGGYDKLDLPTEEELNEKFQQKVDLLFQQIADYYGLPVENLRSSPKRKAREFKKMGKKIKNIRG